MRLMDTYTGHSAWASALAWSPDGQCIASGSNDATVQIWEPAWLATLKQYVH